MLLFNQILYNKIFNVAKHRSFGDEEVSMHVCEKAFQKEKDFSGITELCWAYVYKTIDTTIIDYARKRNCRPKTFEIEYESSKFAVETDEQSQIPAEIINELLEKNLLTSIEKEFLFEYYDSTEKKNTKPKSTSK
jgi:DNA-directed RNA polymerase specialized sigma24 family protein